MNIYGENRRRGASEPTEFELLDTGVVAEKPLFRYFRGIRQDDVEDVLIKYTA